MTTYLFPVPPSIRMDAGVGHPAPITAIDRGARSVNGACLLESRCGRAAVRRSHRLKGLQVREFVPEQETRIEIDWDLVAAVLTSLQVKLCALSVTGRTDVITIIDSSGGCSTSSGIEHV